MPAITTPTSTGMEIVLNALEVIMINLTRCSPTELTSVIHNLEMMTELAKSQEATNLAVGRTTGLMADVRGDLATARKQFVPF